METRAATWQRLIVPVLFTLVCVVVTMLTWRSFGGSLPLEPTDYEVSMRVRDAGNLQPGGEVRVAGVRIGRVRTVARQGTAARVTVGIDPQYVPLRSGTSAIVRSKSLLGEAFLELGLGPRTQPAIPDGATLPDGAVRPNQQLADVIATFDDRTRSDLRSMFAGLAEAVDGRAGDLNDTLGTARPAFDDLERMFAVVDGQRERVDDVIRGSAGVLEAVAANEGALRGFVRNGNAFLVTTARRRADLSATIRALPPFLERLRRASSEISIASPDLLTAMTALEPVAASAPPAFREIDRAAPVFTRAFDRLPAVSRAARRGLPSTTRLLADAPVPLRRFNELARELIPFLQLVAADREEITGVFANVGSVLSGKNQLADGRIVNYGSGIATVWNEAIAGWVRRLPSNRLNPYPKPGGAREIANGGLKAYDCRNVDNVEYLPPTGTGTPDCVEQGPWSLGGGPARRYPRLEATAP